MVAIHKEKDTVRFEILNWHKLMALRSELLVASKNIKKVSRGSQELWKAWGWKLPGTYIPYVVKAGSYYHQGTWEFWDMSQAHNTLVIELQNEPYQRLYLEVENPELAMRLLKA